MKDIEKIAAALTSIAGAIHEHAEATAAVAAAIRKLGLADASTPMGAIEIVGLTLKEELSQIGNALHEIGVALERRDER